MFNFIIKKSVKDPVIILSIIVYFSFVAFVYRYLVTGNPEDGFICVMSQVEIVFLLFMGLSYYLSIKIKKNNIHEILESTITGKAKFYLSNIVILFAVAIIMSVVFYLVAIVSVNKSGVSDVDVWNTIIIKNIIYNHLLVYLVAIIAGTIISKIKSILLGVITLVSAYFSFSMVFVSIMANVVYYNEFLVKLLSYFSFLSRRYNIMPDGYYMFSGEKIDLERMLFWCFFSVGLLCFIMLKKYKKTISVICIVIACVFACLYARPFGFNYTDVVGSAFRMDQEYYQGTNSKQLGKDDSVYKEDFKIKKISGDINVNRVLNANIDIELEKNKLDTYRFTLYHGYKLINITSDGKKVTYSRKGDNICIKTGEKGVRRFNFQYSGYSEYYYTNEQTTFLPGYFAFVPFSGYKKLWYDDRDAEVMKDGTLFIGKFINYEGMGYKVEYNLKIDTEHEVFTNLKDRGNGEYYGKTEGVTIVSSEFAHDMKCASNRVIYSSQLFWNMDNNKTKEYFEDYIKEFKYPKKLKNKTIIIPPEKGNTPYYVASDYILCPIEDLDDMYGNYIKNGEYPYEKSEDNIMEDEEEQ